MFTPQEIKTLLKSIDCSIKQLESFPYDKDLYRERSLNPLIALQKKLRRIRDESKSKKKETTHEV